MNKYVDFGVYSLLILLCVVCSYFLPKNIARIYKPFNRNFSTVLRGLAILTVVWAHAGGKDYGIEGIQWVAGIGVCIFLICSGFGLNESFKKSQLKDFWKKRIISVLIPYYIVYIIGGNGVNLKP